jgi:hypothetical protein
MDSPTRPTRSPRRLPKRQPGRARTRESVPPARQRSRSRSSSTQRCWPALSVARGRSRGSRPSRRDRQGRKGALEAALVCLVATAGSRAIAPFVAALIRRPAEGSGVGRWFIGGTGAGAALVATGSVLVLAGAAAFAISTPALVGGLVGGTVATLAVAVWLARLRDGLDGDGFGALIEVGFAAILLATTLVA